MTAYPISATCPQCGGTEYTCRKPRRLVAFVSDRVCRACNTRYTPPTPVWAGILFLLAGLTLPFLGFFLTSLLVNPFSIGGLICEGAIAALGVAAFIGGIRELINTERALAGRPRPAAREEIPCVMPGSNPSESSPN